LDLNQSAAFDQFLTKFIECTESAQVDVSETGVDKTNTSLSRRINHGPCSYKSTFICNSVRSIRSDPVIRYPIGNTDEMVQRLMSATADD
jgi:hypothetical protein